MAFGHHIHLSDEHLAGNGGLGRYVLLPGDRTRAAKIASHFQEVQVVDNPRGHTSHLGKLTMPGADPVDVMSISSGMGCASVEIIVHELIACGAKRILRVGSCGSLTKKIQVGDVVIVTAAVRDEGTTLHYAPQEFPAIAHPDAVAAMVEGAKGAGLAGRTFRGISHSKDSLYAREFGAGPAGARNREYMEWIGRAGCAVSEMESSALFMLASAASTDTAMPVEVGSNRSEVQAACVLAVYGGDDSNMKLDEKAAAAAEQRAIQVAIEGVRVWAARDRKG